MDTCAEKLLFQWNPIIDGKQRVRRVCQECIFTFEARGDKSALAKAKRIGKSQNAMDLFGSVQVSYEFVGVLELICLMIDDKENDQESWYEIIERRTRNGSLKHLIPEENDLYVFKNINPRGRLKVI